mmetsp:Transcript_15981/g.24083  ORF Transcript_15981/g.24083 Transcript_15981/m.24083 type:complete len:341 (+) Transcript_15981:181-1203(+)|eukprot:CAMPEP_0185030366 /NCGR_PEP_ID=MMETSP1103-20130426/17291_1 /TAXON_ID=36769 /ORGANISM="Paraphysomonas bandaiensis, Strain Caron Lab Isolate" /LENGTH=340 /DNA_ID=CAMNT_0027565467 /DNA_START=118 /DNA_END=1140 /DNA_ORIENTATION=+
MGITGSVPEPDDYAKRAIVLGNLSQKEVKKLYKIFRRYDKEKSGFAKLSVIFESIEEKRTIFTDSICDLLEIENDGKINFGAFLLMVTTYCLFEPREILKFCFFVFDQDKHGYFETDELKMLMNILHRVEDGETVKGNIKISWQNLKFGDDDRVDFEEFEHFHKEFPRLFQPAFSVQINMTRYIMGKRFWENKKNQLEAIRREEKLKQSKDKDSKAARAKRANERKTRKRMGLARYYCCPCLRFMYDGSVLPDQSQEVVDMKAKRAAEIAEAKRLAELRLKNPETQAWNKYKEKKETLVARGNTNFIESQQDKITRNRNKRVEDRKERRKRRDEEQKVKY